MKKQIFGLMAAFLLVSSGAWADYTVTYAIGDGSGIVPAAVTAAESEEIILPKNYSMYKNGYTLTGWSDGVNTYSPGASYVVNTNTTLTAVYTENTVTLDDRTTNVLIKWEFSQVMKVPAISLNYSGANKTGFVVAQAEVAGNTIDVPLMIDCSQTADAKFVNRNDMWTQINPGTIFTIPSSKGAIIKYKQYDNGAVTTPEIEITSSNATYDLVGSGTSGNLYYEYIQVVLPKFRGFALNFLETWAKNGISAEAANDYFVTSADAEGVATIENPSKAYIAAFNGKFHGQTYGLYPGAKVVFFVDGWVKISAGTNNYGGNFTVTNAAGQTVAMGNNYNASQNFSSSHPEYITSVYYCGGATTLTCEFQSGGTGYLPYIAVEAIEGLPVKLNEVAAATHGFATFCSPSNFTVSGATAYKGALSGGNLVLTPLAGIIPANEGVILAGTPGATATITPTELDATADVTGNGLHGTTIALDASSHTSSPWLLVLNKDNNNFVKFTGTVPANKAYLIYNEAGGGSLGAPSIHMEIDEVGNATDIQNIEACDKAVKFFENGQMLILREGVVYDAIGRIVR